MSLLYWRHLSKIYKAKTAQTAQTQVGRYVAASRETCVICRLSLLPGIFPTPF
ncbi:hypothetical protein HNQ93_001222 [Hymenobacter luteus]|uniref:Uncharacterized protein n=2 Tax=Hymenobacter TaxID=89966 RepID=A0A7W9SZ22_9BACT|nr:hypothetical protein [Hymenobacter latericoloratus]MBB6058376.1 hypothetical protein [Hymenobacter luteus]